ncbi:hypothetical protein FEM48_Zijuj08G0098400 [Ziziphus jujuba var. spinosa]|uniref:Gamma carbonic anhydrase 1, mitochondrial n=1 Tax=Ziziphus jujuba var. spinosa TaxID=714518 RepID=A0A978UYE5_ZIZJJ|nr:hypothetical protein FEM48_Zijuj08G0098400 [Ziziphus jujuba var. spinosa]
MGFLFYKNENSSTWQVNDDMFYTWKNSHVETVSPLLLSNISSPSSSSLLCLPQCFAFTAERTPNRNPPPPPFPQNKKTSQSEVTNTDYERRRWEPWERQSTLSDSGSVRPAKQSIASAAVSKAVTTSKNSVLSGSIVLGSGFCGINFDRMSRHRTLMNVFDKAPVVDKDVFVAPSASIIGDVQVGRGSSIWYGCVLRGDVNSINIGAGTNIQDNSLVHVAKSNLSGKVLPTIIGDNVTVGHSAILHGCTVEDEAFVGMGATLLDGVYVEKHAMVAAGALVRQNTRVPCGEVWAGNPAKFLRKLTEEEMAFISQSALNYSNLARVHEAENAKGFDEIEFEKVLRKKFARRDEEYDSMLGVVRETPPELVLPDNILPDKVPKAS